MSHESKPRPPEDSEEGALPTQPEEKALEKSTQPSISQVDKKPKKPEKRGWTFRLATLLALVAGAGVAASVYRKYQIDEAVKPLRADWQRVTRVEPAPFPPRPKLGNTILLRSSFAGEIEDLLGGFESRLRQHNENIRFYEPSVSMRDVVPSAEVIELLRKHGRAYFEEFNRFDHLNDSPNAQVEVVVDKGEFEGEVRITDNGSEESWRLYKQISVLREVAALAQIGHMSMDELISQEKNSTSVRSAVREQAAGLWKHIEQMHDSGDTALRRSFYARFPWGYDWSLSYTPDNTYAQRNFKVPVLVNHIQQLLALGEVDPKGAGIDPARAKEILTPEIIGLWTKMEDFQEFGGSYAEEIYQITVLSRFIRQKPEEIIDPAQWQAALKRTATLEVTEIQESGLPTKYPVGSARLLLFLLEQGQFNPNDPEINLLGKQWEQAKKTLGSKPDIANFEDWSELQKKIDEKFKSESKTQPQPEDQGAAVKDTHKAFLREKFETILAQKPPSEPPHA